MLSIIY